MEEVFTISRWSGGSHYYVSSTARDVFSKQKFNTEQAAAAWCRDLNPDAEVRGVVIIPSLGDGD